MNELSKTILILEEDYVNYLIFKEYYDDHHINLIRIHNMNQIRHYQLNNNIDALIIGETGFNSSSKQALFHICKKCDFPVFIERGTCFDQSNDILSNNNCWLIDLFSDEMDIINIIEDYSSHALVNDVAYESISTI